MCKRNKNYRICNLQVISLNFISMFFLLFFYCLSNWFAAVVIVVVFFFFVNCVVLVFRLVLFSSGRVNVTCLNFRLNHAMANGRLSFLVMARVSLQFATNRVLWLFFECLGRERNILLYCFVRLKYSSNNNSQVFSG